MAKTGKTYRISKKTAELLGISEEVTEEQLQQWIAEARAAPEDVPEPPPEQLVQWLKEIRAARHAREAQQSAHANRP
jgi:hypothetical protein